MNNPHDIEFKTYDEIAKGLIPYYPENVFLNEKHQDGEDTVYSVPCGIENMFERYIFNSKNQLIGIENPIGDIRSVKIHYNEKGLVFLIEKFNSKGILFPKIEISYSEHNIHVRKTYYNDDNTIYEIIAINHSLFDGYYVESIHKGYISGAEISIVNKVFKAGDTIIKTCTQTTNDENEEITESHQIVIKTKSS